MCCDVKYFPSSVQNNKLDSTHNSLYVHELNYKVRGFTPLKLVLHRPNRERGRQQRFDCLVVIARRRQRRSGHLSVWRWFESSSKWFLQHILILVFQFIFHPYPTYPSQLNISNRKLIAQKSSHYVILLVMNVHFMIHEQWQTGYSIPL